MGSCHLFFGVKRWIKLRVPPEAQQDPEKRGVLVMGLFWTRRGGVREEVWLPLVELTQNGR